MKNTISIDEYYKIKHGARSMSTNDLIDAHRDLVGESCSDEYYEIEDCGVELVADLLQLDRGWTRPYHYPPVIKSFFKSEYLSDYYKNSIKKLLSSETLSEEVTNALNSDKLINDMTEEEIKGIWSSVRLFYANTTEKTCNVSAYFTSYLLKLDGNGVKSFIKNNMTAENLSDYILNTSGLTSRSSYYSGRGVKFSDLNSDHLTEIFKKLLKYDKDWALEFVEMVKKMKTLGATEFIESFKSFAYNGFKTKGMNIEDSNISLDGVYGEARNAVAYFSLLDVMSRGQDEQYQIDASNQMKEDFISKIYPQLKKLNAEDWPLFNGRGDRSLTLKRSK